MKKLLYLLCSLVILTSCEKELSLEGEIPEPPPGAVEPDPVDTTPVYQLTAFYSDIPVDFDESDGNTELETDLWKYVKDYVKDDYHVFTSDTTVSIIQNELKMPGRAEDVLYLTYSRGTDDLGEYLMYFTANYNPMKYRIHEVTEDHFVIGIKWKDGARLYSRFDRIR